MKRAMQALAASMVMTLAGYSPAQSAPEFPEVAGGGRAVSARRLGTPQIAERGARRGARLGVEIRSTSSGAVQVASVARGSAAERAGLRAGDELLAFEGAALSGAESLIAAVRERRPQTEVKLRLRRVLALELDGAQRTGDGRFALGAFLTDDPERVVVQRLAPGYPAVAAGLLAGDQITALDGAAVARERDLAERMRAIEVARRVEVTVERDVRVRLDAAAQLELPPAPPVAPAPPTGLADRELLEQVAALRREIEALRAEVERLRRQLARPAAR